MGIDVVIVEATVPETRTDVAALAAMLGSVVVATRASARAVVIRRRRVIPSQ
jgi:hypothetical protein